MTSEDETELKGNGTPLRPLLEVRNVSKRYRLSHGAVDALSDVSFALNRGEFVAVVGPSGCGKSTLLDIAAELQEPTSGTVIFDGMCGDGRTGRVGYMAQNDLLLPWRTVLDNTILGLQANGMRKGPAREVARRHFPRFGLSGFEDRYPAVLSGGMRRRAALLRTILFGRDILLLDEPFGALDALTRIDLHEWLLDVMAEFHTSIVLVTHDVDEAIYLADRVLILSERPGTVVAELSIDIPRPRHYESCVSAPEFAHAKRIALSFLRHGRPEFQR